MNDKSREAFFQQLREAVRFAKIRRNWASEILRDREQKVRQAERELKKWGGSIRPPRARKRK